MKTHSHRREDACTPACPVHPEWRPWYPDVLVRNPPGSGWDR